MTMRANETEWRDSYPPSGVLPSLRAEKGWHSTIFARLCESSDSGQAAAMLYGGREEDVAGRPESVRTMSPKPSLTNSPSDFKAALSDH